MITGTLKSQIDSVWDDFWSGGISNPLEVMEQLTYLLFVRALDEEQTRAENKAARTKQPIDNPVFPQGTDPKGQPYENLRWSRFKNLAPAEMYKTVDEHVFPFLHEIAEDTTHAQHMANARLTIPTPALLQKAVDGLDAVPMEDRDTKGDVYEYMQSLGRKAICIRPLV